MNIPKGATEVFYEGKLYRVTRLPHHVATKPERKSLKKKGTKKKAM